MGINLTGAFIQMKTPLLSNPGFTGGLHCKTCDRPIRNPFQSELICFHCWNTRHRAQQQRHHHGIEPPKPKPKLGGMV